MVQPEHQPVMLAEVLELLRPRDGGRYVDLTLGLGGHAAALLERSAPGGQVLGLDRDPQSLCLARERLRRFGDRVITVHGCFADLPSHLESIGWQKVDGLLADLGLSSWQLEEGQRGFSFQVLGPLDMRMDSHQGPTLLDLLHQSREGDLARVLERFGQVRGARSVARRILAALRQGQLSDSLALARVGREPGPRGHLHPATRVFQALRIWVNGEMEQLNALLALLPEPLAVGGRAVFISFHSLEDRAIKQRFRQLAAACRCPPGLPECRCGARIVARPLSHKALRPSASELALNPRARSAKLRALERLAA